MRPDPPPARGGGCAICGCPRPRIAILNADPFCSTMCAREWFGTQIPKHRKAA